MPDKRIGAVLLAAGSSQRMGADKLAMRFGGVTPVEACLSTFMSCKTQFDCIIITASEDNIERVSSIAGRYSGVRVILGGSTRGGSVLRALREIDCDTVAIHDAARCLVTGDIIERSIASANKYGSGIAGIWARDTLHKDGAAIDREGVFMAQTPQSFDRNRILEAYELAQKNDTACTDDCAIFRLAGNTPHYVEGSIMNQKLTGREDVTLFSAVMRSVRSGIGEDTHRLVADRKLILGGVDIPYTKGLLGHSDADVLAHAVIDALLGAAGLPDIGRQFPDSDSAYAGICSMELVKRTAGLIANAGFTVGNVDAVIVAEAPKLAPYIGSMRENIAAALGIEADRVNVKATTTEGMGPEGRGECMSARSVCLLYSC